MIFLFEEIKNGIEKFSKVGKTYITGDVNSRTAHLLDILEFDKYLDVNNDDKIYVDDKNDFSCMKKLYQSAIIKIT